MNKENFKTLSDEEKLAVIQSMEPWSDRHQILELLLSIPIEEMDAKLLGELGKAYNNNGEYEKAMAVLDRVVEEERDARWHYRYAYSHSELAKNPNYDFETEARKALTLFDKAVVLGDEEIVYDCSELVDCYELEEILEKHKDNFPHIAEKYAKYKIKESKKEENMQPQKKKTYKKITTQNIKNIEDSWGICEPMFRTINIYDGYEKYLKSTYEFTLEQRYLSAIHWYWGEVINGGYHQFFYNSTGIVWEDALNGLWHFRMPEYAANFQKVIDYLGGTTSFDRLERYDMLKALQEKNEEEFFKVLDEADNFVYKYEGEENEINYIKANPEKFVFEGEYEAF